MYKLVTLGYIYPQEGETGIFRRKFTLPICKSKFIYEPNLQVYNIS